MGKEEVTMEEVWAGINELRKAQAETDRQLKESYQEMKESKKETDRRMEESRIETDRRMEESRIETNRVLKESYQEMKESKKEVDEHLKKLSESIKDANGNFNNKWGDFLESFVEGDLIKIFQKRNIEVNQVYPRSKVSRNNRDIVEYDFVIPNGDIVIVVEVKTAVSSNKLDSFIKKLNQFKEYNPIYKNHKVYGAIAYMRASEKLLEEAKKYGLYLIKAPGGENDVTILTNPEDFTPTIYGD